MGVRATVQTKNLTTVGLGCETVLPQGFLSGIKSEAFMTDFEAVKKMLEAEMTQMKVAAKFKWNEFQK